MMKIVLFVKKLLQPNALVLGIVDIYFIQTVFQNGSHEAYFAQTVVMIFARQIPPEVQTPPIRQTHIPPPGVGRRRRLSSFISSIETDQDVGTITVDSTHNLPRVNSPLGGSLLEESRISHTEDTEESDEHHA
jgi:hypothetical protein